MKSAQQEASERAPGQDPSREDEFYIKSDEREASERAPGQDPSPEDEFYIKVMSGRPPRELLARIRPQRTNLI